MKQALILCAALLVAGVAGGQEPSVNANARPENVPDDTGLRTVVGCLSKTDNTYVITGGGPGPKQFRILSGDTTKLRHKIGQTVEVFGMVGKSDPAEVAAPPYHEGSTTGVGYNTINVQKVKVLGGLCSNPGQEWKGDHMK
jgi:hypothetical protein